MKDERRTLTVELSGGLANQLFQWAAGFLIAGDSDAQLVLDCRLVNRPDGRGYQLGPLIPQVPLIDSSARESGFWRWAHRRLPRKATGMLKRFRRHTFSKRGNVTAGTYAAARAALNSSTSVRMVGLFQDVEEVVIARDRIVAALQVPRLPDGYTPGEYVAMHVRRGDYVTNPKYARIFGSCSREYYKQALTLISPVSRVVVASDDRQWAESLKGDESGHWIELSSGNDHFEDLSVLANARQLVLSNSTFSWWGAFLSGAEQVVVPEPWFTDRSRDRGLVLEGWIPVDRDSKVSP